jgi:hypothetical protein
LATPAQRTIDPELGHIPRRPCRPVPVDAAVLGARRRERPRSARPDHEAATLSRFTSTSWLSATRTSAPRGVGTGVIEPTLRAAALDAAVAREWARRPPLGARRRRAAFDVASAVAAVPAEYGCSPTVQRTLPWSPRSSRSHRSCHGARERPRRSNEPCAAVGERRPHPTVRSHARLGHDPPLVAQTG